MISDPLNNLGIFPQKIEKNCLKVILLLNFFISSERSIQINIKYLTDEIKIPS